MSTPSDQRIARIAEFFETLSPQGLAHLPEIYSPDARFKDPFNQVQGLDAISRIFEHMYVSLHEPRFVVIQSIAQGDDCFLVWDFKFRFKRFDTHTEQTVRGCSQLRLLPDGKISDHRDYWDAAEELYEKLPLVGGLMRWLKKRANQ